MTQGIVSIRKDSQMLFKIITGHDGMNARKVTSRVRALDHIPTVDELKAICAEESFGCADCLVILENDPGHWNKPIAHCSKDIDWDVVEGADKYNDDLKRYYDTFHVAQFNPRWRYGTADYVEVMDLDDEELPGPSHLWTDEQVAEMKAKGVITEDKPESFDKIEDLDIPF
jgi:hypothetical protein